MAEEKKEGEAAEEAPKKGGKKKLIIIIAVVVILLGAVGAFFALSGGGDEDEEADEEAAVEEGHGEGELPGAIVPLETFIVNLQVKGSFLKVAVGLELATPEPPHDLETNIPKVRDGIIKILSSKGSAEILSAEGKDKLREEIRTKVNEVLGGEEVVQVYFTEFIVQ